MTLIHNFNELSGKLVMRVYTSISCMVLLLMIAIFLLSEFLFETVAAVKFYVIPKFSRHEI